MIEEHFAMSKQWSTTRIFRGRLETINIWPLWLIKAVITLCCLSFVISFKYLLVNSFDYFYHYFIKAFPKKSTYMSMCGCVTKMSIFPSHGLGRSDSIISIYIALASIEFKEQRDSVLKSLVRQFVFPWTYWNYALGKLVNFTKYVSRINIAIFTVNVFHRSGNLCLSWNDKFFWESWGNEYGQTDFEFC